MGLHHHYSVSVVDGGYSLFWSGMKARKRCTASHDVPWTGLGATVFVYMTTVNMMQSENDQFHTLLHLNSSTPTYRNTLETVATLKSEPREP